MKSHFVLFVLGMEKGKTFILCLCPMTFSGHRPDFMLLHSEGLKGFPAVLQQLSKILNYSCASQGQSKSGSMLYCYVFLLECAYFKFLPSVAVESSKVFSFLSLVLFFF